MSDQLNWLLCHLHSNRMRISDGLNSQNILSRSWYSIHGVPGRQLLSPPGEGHPALMLPTGFRIC